MSANVRLCPSKSAYVRLSPPMSVYVRLCPPMSAYVLSFLDSMRQADIDGRDTLPGCQTKELDYLKITFGGFVGLKLKRKRLLKL